MTEIELAITKFANTLPNGSRVLDVGCGLRPYEKYFMCGSYVGIDVYESGREAAGKLADYEFDGVNIPLEDQSFDAVICTEVLEHAVDPSGLLVEMARVTRTGGQLFVTVPFMWGLHELPYDFRRYTTVGIQKEISNAGFRVKFCEKLTPGTSAINMLISSETNYYLNTVATTEQKNSFKFKFNMKILDYLQALTRKIWRRTITFERIYIDNLVIAEKSEMGEINTK